MRRSVFLVSRSLVSSHIGSLQRRHLERSEGSRCCGWEMLRFAQHDEVILTQKGLAQCAGRFSWSLAFSFLHTSAYLNGVTLSEAKVSVLRVGDASLRSA
jgi:hypothetical protein